MIGRLAGVGAKVERAKEHIAHLKQEVDVFLKSEPYVVLAENDEKTGDRVFRVHIVRNIPMRLSIIAGDAIHNLRASLDYLMWQLVEANGNTPDRGTEFLIAESADNFSTQCKGKMMKMGVGATAMDLIESLNPYKGGNDGLYALHRLDIRDKHRLLLAVGALRDRIIYGPQAIQITEVRVGGPEGPKLPFAFKPDWVAFHYAPAHTAFPLREGAEIERIAAESLNKPNVDTNPKFGFQVAFGEAGVLEGEPLVESLSKLAQVVSGILDVFAALPELK